MIRRVWSFKGKAWGPQENFVDGWMSSPTGPTTSNGDINALCRSLCPLVCLTAFERLVVQLSGSICTQHRQITCPFLKGGGEQRPTKSLPILLVSIVNRFHIIDSIKQEQDHL